MYIEVFMSRHQFVLIRLIVLSQAVSLHVDLFCHVLLIIGQTK